MNIDSYNHITLFLFLIPIIKGFSLGCNIFSIINTYLLVIGFIYHYSLLITKEFTFKIKLLRAIDILGLHILGPYSLYESKYNNKYFYYSFSSLAGIVFVYYFFPIIFKVRAPHVIIHILGSIAFTNCLDSCFLNKELCSLC